MFGGPLLQIIAILLLVFLAMSAIVSTVQELLTQIFSWRSRSLRKGIMLMLEDSHYKDEIGKRFFRSPMIASLGKSKNRITNIDPEVFATAMATAIQPKWSTDDPIAAVPASVLALHDGELKQRLRLVLPPVSGQPDRELIKKSLIAWFDSSISKIQHRFKADQTAISYVIAAIATVTLNVSPLEIVHRLLSDEQLRVSFAAAVPELTDVAFRTESTVSSALLGLDGTAQATEAAAPTLAGTSGNRLGLSASDLELMKSIFRCRESDMGLPIGWPWMGPAVDSLEKTSVAAVVGGSLQGGECNVAPVTTSANPELEKRLAAFESLLGPESKTAMGKQYGPDFQTDNPGIILLGWLLTTLAASMGAPFWFQLIRKLIGR